MRYTKSFLMLALTFAAMAAAGRAAAGQNAFTFWCAAAPSATQLAGGASVSDLSRPASLFCSGRYADAVAAYAAVVPYWRAHQTDGRNWLIAARGYFVALLATGRDAQAQQFLETIGAGDKHLSAGDRLFIDADLKGAFRWFGAHADGFDGPPPEPPDAAITDAAKALQAGDRKAALAALKRPSNSTGPSSNHSEQLLMLGDLYASQREWNEAFATWAAAANQGHAVPEYDTFDSYNLAALEMLYYFRGHLSRAG
jgi:hypothetical protein